MKGSFSYQVFLYQKDPKRNEPKGGNMFYKMKDVKSGSLKDWLGGMTLREKIRSLERGKFWFCWACGKEFFDKETEVERSLYKCKPEHYSHSYMPGGKYLVLKRGFKGILWYVRYQGRWTAEDAVIEFFNESKKTRRACHGNSQNRNFKNQYL